MMNKNEEPKLWTKYIDTRYISGEDLKARVNGLAEQMDVYLYNAVEGETFDQKTNSNETKWILHFKTFEENMPLYKGVVANKGAKDALKSALMFWKKIDSNVIQDCYSIPITMFAQKDKRHGYVVRFKPYRQSAEFKKALADIELAESVKDLEKAYKSLSDNMKKNAFIIDRVNTLKSKL